MVVISRKAEDLLTLIEKVVVDSSVVVIISLVKATEIHDLHRIHSVVVRIIRI